MTFDQFFEHLKQNRSQICIDPLPKSDSDDDLHKSLYVLYFDFDLDQDSKIDLSEFQDFF